MNVACSRDKIFRPKIINNKNKREEKRLSAQQQARLIHMSRNTFNGDLLDLVTTRNSVPERLLGLLKPMNRLIDDPHFLEHINEIAMAITQDRNGNKTFTLEDLELLASDLKAVAQIVKAVILLIASAPEVNMRYQPGITEDIIRNVLIYIVLVVVPKHIGRAWSAEEQQKIVELMATMHEMVLASRTVENGFKKVLKWFQRRNFCVCCMIENVSEDVIEQNLPALNTQIEASINKNRILLSKGKCL